MTEADARPRLLALLKELSFARREVVLASGRKSDWFIDCKQTVLTAEGHALVGAAMLDAVLALPKPADAVAGVELGGCPLASAVSLLSHQRGGPLDAVYVRKTVKDHGSRRELEGDARLEDGANVVVLEDVVTTGGSTLTAVSKLRDRGLEVTTVVAIVDRGEGGEEALAAAGLHLVSLFGRRDFMGE
jgi:orotate phosphoribosyltransferase